MKIIQILALVANVAAFAWSIYMCFTYVPLARELLLAGAIVAFPLLNIIALAGTFRSRKA